MSETNITFIPLNETHIALMHRWLSSGEAKRWYGSHADKTEAELRQKYLVDKPQGGTHCFIIQHKKTPIGYIQYYRVSDYPAWCALVSGQTGDYGLDIFIGEDDYIGRGIGTRTICAALNKLIFSNEDAQRGLMGPDPENHRAIRCYEKCGFQHLRTVTAENGEKEYLMGITRREHFQSFVSNIVELDATLADMCQSEFEQIGWTKPPGYFAAQVARQNHDDLVFYVALDDKHYGGHVKLVWKPDYVHFRQAGIPEIQDLNVLPAYRKRGIATRLIQRCEITAATRCDHIGIGVGLHPGYNAAQRLYPKLGYILDGHGVHYDGVPVVERQSYRFDDELIIYFTKTLNEPSAVSHQLSAKQKRLMAES
jgi:RimJ/RimL family protein N-acetyltransferase